jgi:hypothetical protein
MQANSNAQRYADILTVIKDGKISSEEVDNLAKAWGIPREAVIAYITKVTGISQEAFPGLDTPGLSAASGWNSAKAAVDAYYAALNALPTVAPTGMPTAAPSSFRAPTFDANQFALGGIAQDSLEQGASAGLSVAAAISGSRYAAQGAASFGGGTVINNYITTVDPSTAGDAVVDAINSSTNIRGGFQGIGVSRAVTIL